MKIPSIKIPRIQIPRLALPGARPPKPVEDVIQQQERQLNEMQQAFSYRRKQEKERFEQATDSEFWVALCFQTREQKEKFLAAIGMLEDGDKYLDGLAFAKACDVDLERVNLERKHRSIGKDFVDLLPERIDE